MNDASFLKWADQLMARVPRYDWPDLTGEYWEGIRGLLAPLAPSDLELSRLLAGLQRTPPRGLDGAFARIAEELASIRASGEAGPDERKRAEAESRGCVECSGCGLVSRDHERADYGRFAASYYCHRCPMGRWLKAAHGRDPKGVRLADLAEHPALWTSGEDAIDPEQVRRFRVRQDRAREAAARLAGSRGRPRMPTAAF